MFFGHNEPNPKFKLKHSHHLIEHLLREEVMNSTHPVSL